MKSKQKIFNIYEMITFMLITTVVASLACGFIMFKLYDKKEVKPDYSQLTKDEYLSDFIDSYSKIIDRYYDGVDKEKLIDSAISGMLDSIGEKYTEYLNEDDSADLLEQLEGEYTGIGVRIDTNEEGKVLIYEVFPGSPAETAGVKAGDIFIKINDISVEGKNAEDISKEIKYGKSETSIIVFDRNGKEETITITRTKVTIPSVVEKIIDYGRYKVGYIKIATFANTTPEQFNKAMIVLNENNIDKLIIDLRGNTGGYLDSVSYISEQLLEKNKVIYSIETKEGKVEVRDTTDQMATQKIVILVDSMTASASEILAGALRDSYGAKLVGVKTFGKGKIQETDSLSSGGLIKITTGKWFIPSGANIDEIGLLPDYEVAIDQKYLLDRIESNDNQLQKALEVIVN